MLHVLKQLWSDQAGFVVSAELVLISTVGVIGLATGLTCVRDAVNSELSDVGCAISSLDQSYCYTGFHSFKDPCHCQIKARTAGSSNVPYRNEEAELVPVIEDQLQPLPEFERNESVHPREMSRWMIRERESIELPSAVELVPIEVPLAPPAPPVQLAPVDVPCPPVIEAEASVDQSLSISISASQPVLISGGTPLAVCPGTVTTQMPATCLPGSVIDTHISLPAPRHSFVTAPPCFLGTCSALTCGIGHSGYSTPAGGSVTGGWAVSGGSQLLGNPVYVVPHSGVIQAQPSAVWMPANSRSAYSADHPW